MEEIKEEMYQKIKKTMNRNSDYFTLEEIKQFTNIDNFLGEIQANEP